MKKVDINQLHIISGGTQSMEITTKIIYEGVSESCIADYFANNQATLTQFTPDELNSDIINRCRISNTTYSEFAITSLKMT